MIVQNKYVYEYYDFAGSDKALVTFMRIERAITSRGFSIDPPGALKNAVSCEYVWPGIGRVMIEKTEGKKGLYRVTFLAGAIQTRIEDWFAPI